MQAAFSKFAQNDYAKYPFLKEATKYIKPSALKIEDLTAPQFQKILNRAEEKLQEAILYTRIMRKPEEPEIEISSYPVAIILAIATKNTYIQKRYALAEAKQTYEDLKNETKQKLLFFAQNYEWKLSPNTNDKIPYEFTLNYTNYLQNITHLRDKKWKLVNRLLTNGNVYLTRNETARILSEEVRKHIEKRFETKELPTFPPKIMEIAEKIKKLSIEKIGTAEMEGFPQTIQQTAFPPCIQNLYTAFTTGRHLSHVGRFTLTAFLINIGMPPEKVVELFKNFSDYNTKLTSYQVEHIAGERGSRTRYTSPKCDTLQTHGICTNPDETCQKIRHPLNYYKKKLKTS